MVNNFNYKQFELPAYLENDLAKAKRLEWITIAYLCSVIVIMFLVMGSSQAMKTAWLEDLLSIVPSIAFLIASKFYDKKPTIQFPYGFHRVFSIAYLTGALALLSMGIFLIIDSAMSLIQVEKPSIGSMMIGNNQIWMGWIMIIALLYSAVPAVILGRKKMPLAKKLHNKILFTDAETQKADYQTALAAIFGIIGVGLGFWWADALMAILISFSIIKDGYKNTKRAIEDLMDSRPQQTDHQKADPLLKDLQHIIEAWDWVEAYDVRFREHGQVYFGEIMVVPKWEHCVEHIEEGVKELKRYHWKVYDVTIMPVVKLN